jgi:hypothetical protein
MVSIKTNRTSRSFMSLIWRDGKRVQIKFWKKPQELTVREAYVFILDERLDFKWTDNDRKEILSLPKVVIRRMGNLLKMPGADASKIADELCGPASGPASQLMKKGRKMMKAEKKPEPTWVEAAKEVVPQEEVEEKTKPEPLPPKLEKLTVKDLKKLLVERNLATEGKKAELIKRLSEGKGGL